MDALTIIKTKQGYLVIPIPMENVTIVSKDVVEGLACNGLTGPYGGTTDGVFGALKNHFEPPQPSGEKE